MSALPSDRPTPTGVAYALSDDGLCLVSTWTDDEGGVIRSKMTWPDEETALANYGNAMSAFEKRLPAFIARLDDPEQNQHRTLLFRRKHFNVIVNIGPPTWLIPRPHMRRGAIGIGWLRVAVQVVVRKQASEGSR